MATEFVNAKYSINALSNSVKAECRKWYPWIKEAQGYAEVIHTENDEVFLTKISYQNINGDRIVFEPHKLIVVPTFGYAQSICHFNDFDSFVKGEIY